MADRKYYVLCQNNCKFESMTKEQILAAIAEATGATVTDIDNAFISKIKEINKGAAVQIWLGTTAEYNALVVNGEKRSDVFYIKTDDTTLNDIIAAHAANRENPHGVTFDQVGAAPAGNYIEIKNIRSAADYNKVVEIWDSLTAGKPFIIYFVGDTYPYGGAAFGYKWSAGYGSFIFMHYGGSAVGGTIKFINVYDGTARASDIVIEKE